MIKHILRLIWNQRKSNGWLLGELLLVSVCLWYVTDYFLTVLSMFNTPVGFDTSHTYQFRFASREEGAENYILPEEHPATAGENIWEAVERLRRYPEIEAVSISQYGVPYTHIDNYVSLSPDTASQAESCRFCLVTPEYFDVYRFSFTEGSYRQLKGMFAGNTVVVTDDVAGKLFGTRSAFRETVYTGDRQTMQIGGVTGGVRRNEFERKSPQVFMPFTETEIKTYPVDALPWVEVSVRVKPEADKDFANTYMREWSDRLETGNLYLQDITPVSMIRDDDLREYKSRMNVRLAILFFLLVNIFLGIVGTFWFRTRHRRSEMGLRMALGSTRNQLRRVVMSEGILLLSIAFIPALLICVNILYLDLTDTSLLDNSPLRFWGGIAVTYILMSSMILLGSWYPAAEAARTEPAESLHYE